MGVVGGLAPLPPAWYPPPQTAARGSLFFSPPAGPTCTRAQRKDATQWGFVFKMRPMSGRSGAIFLIHGRHFPHSARFGYTT